jgi:hypothetical protein
MTKFYLMKINHIFHGWIKNAVRLGLVGGLSLLMGFASSSMAQMTQTNQTAQPKQNEKPANVPPLPAGAKLHKDQNIQGVWLADGFNFKGYQTLYLTPVVFAAIERTNEVAARAVAMQELPEQLADNLRDTQLFATATTRSEDVKSGTKTLRLDNTIIEYSKGGGAARYFAGHFGGGQPVIKVRGQIFDGDKLVCVYEIKRSGVLHAGRITGAAMSDEDLQRADIYAVARDLASFFKRTAGVQ